MQMTSLAVELCAYSVAIALICRPSQPLNYQWGGDARVFLAVKKLSKGIKREAEVTASVRNYYMRPGGLKAPPLLLYRHLPFVCGFPVT